MATGLEQIIYSTATCKKCGDVLVSRYRHDYIMCTCDNKTMLDGGLEYQRFGGKDIRLVDLSGTVYLSDGFEKCRLAPIWGDYGKDGSQPVNYISVSEMDTEVLESVIKEIGPRLEKWRLDLMTQELEQRKTICN
jgi:hypothetical protein